MSRKDRDRLKVLHEVRKRHIKQVQAGKELAISRRWVREWLRRMKARGDRAVVHGLRGKRSNRRLPGRLSTKLCLRKSCGSLEAGLEHGIELGKYRTDGPARSFPTALLREEIAKPSLSFKTSWEWK